MACQEWVAEGEEGGWNLNIKGCPDWSRSRNVGDTWTAGLYIILCRALRPNLRTVLQLLSPTKRKLPHYNNAISKSLSSAHCAGQYGEWLLILVCGWLWHVDNHNWASLCVSSCGRKTRNSYLIKWISLVPQSRSEGGGVSVGFWVRQAMMIYDKEVFTCLRFSRPLCLWLSSITQSRACVWDDDNAKQFTKRFARIQRLIRVLTEGLGRVESLHLRGGYFYIVLLITLGSHLSNNLMVYRFSSNSYTLLIHYYLQTPFHPMQCACTVVDGYS